MRAVLLAWLAVAVVLWWRHGRNKHDELPVVQYDAKSATIGSTPSLLASTTYSSTAGQELDIEQGLQLQQQQQHRRPCSSLREGWAKVHSITCPAVAPVKDSSVHFGEYACFCSLLEKLDVLLVSAWYRRLVPACIVVRVGFLQLLLKLVQVSL
jgi:hypothetical protein